VYSPDVNAMNNMGVPVVWENVQNLGNYKQYVRMKVPYHARNGSRAVFGWLRIDAIFSPAFSLPMTSTT
jgi:hypothetical protein